MRDFIKWLTSDGKGYLVSIFIIGLLDFGFIKDGIEIFEHNSIWVGILVILLLTATNVLFIYKMLRSFFDR